MRQNFLLWLILIASFINKGYIRMDITKIYGLTDENILKQIVLEEKKVIKSDPSDIKTIKILGIAYHNLSALEIKGASQKAVEYLEKFYKALNDDNEVLAFLGSATTMLARDLNKNIFKKVKMIKEGIKMIDEAIKNEPYNIPIRLVRARNSRDLPEFFKRKRYAKEDYLNIEILLKREPFNKIYEYIEAEVYYQIGKIYQSEGNQSLATKYFKKASESSQDSEWKIKAMQELSNGVIKGCKEAI